MVRILRQHGVCHILRVSSTIVDISLYEGFLNDNKHIYDTNSNEYQHLA